MNSDLSSRYPAMLPKVDTFKTYLWCGTLISNPFSYTRSPCWVFGQMLSTSCHGNKGKQPRCTLTKPTIAVSLGKIQGVKRSSRYVNPYYLLHPQAEHRDQTRLSIRLWAGDPNPWSVELLSCMEKKKKKAQVHSGVMRGQDVTIT